MYCYAMDVSKVPKTYADGRAFCTAGTADGLAVIHTETQESLLRAFLLTYADDYFNNDAQRTFYLDLTDTTGTNVFTWPDTSPTSYLGWNSATEPSSPGTENCATMTNTHKMWNDVPCATTYPIVCAKQVRL